MYTPRQSEKAFKCLKSANKCLNETTEVSGDIPRHHSKHGDSSTHKSIFTGQL